MEKRRKSKRKKEKGNGKSLIFDFFIHVKREEEEKVIIYEISRDEVFNIKETSLHVVRFEFQIVYAIN